MQRLGEQLVPLGSVKDEGVEKLPHQLLARRLRATPLLVIARRSATQKRHRRLPHPRAQKVEHRLSEPYGRPAGASERLCDNIGRE